MKIFFLLFLLYTGYKLIMPKPRINREDNYNRVDEDLEYTDYEEIED